MADKPPKIDISKPGGKFLKPQDAKLLIIFVSVMAMVVAGAWVYSSIYTGKKQKKEIELIIQEGIDPSYLLTYTPPKVMGEGSSHASYFDAPKEDGIMEGSKEKVVKVTLAPQKALAPKTKPGANDFFVFEGVNIDPKILMAQKINAARAGSLKVQVSITPEERAAFLKAKKAKIEFENSQADFKGQEGKIKATFPVDLSRVLTADKRITAVLENDIASELGGKVTAKVMSNVYASQGAKILIPAGSSVIGYYKPLDKIGQERIEINVARIITPNGINIHLGNGEITDAMGRSGITGDLDRRYLERYGMAFTVALVNAAAMYNLNVETANQQLVVESAGREISTLSKAILDDHIQIKPRVNIPHGSIVHISAPSDIWFKKPVKNEVYAVVKKRNGEWK